MNKQLEEAWLTKRGIVLTSLAIELNVDDESKDKISKFQEAAAAQNNGLLYAMDRMSINKARETAAGNEGGAMAGFMGMGMAGGMMSQPMNAPDGTPNPQGSMAAVQNAQNAAAASPAPAPSADDGWTCSWQDGKYRKVLCRMRFSKACRRLGMRVRSDKQRQVLYRMRQAKACRRAALQVR